MIRSILTILVIAMMIFSGCSLSDNGGEASATTSEAETTSAAMSGTTYGTTESESGGSSLPEDEGPVVYIYKDTNMLYVMEGGEVLISAPVSCPAELAAGEYAVRGRSEWLSIESGRYIKNVLMLEEGCSISSPYYYAKDKNTLIRGSYNSIGKDNVTEGMIFIQADASSWLFGNCQNGTAVRVREIDDTGLEALRPIPVDMRKAFTDPSEPEESPGEKLPYYIYVEKGSASITIFGLDENGGYSNLIKTYRTALGRTPGRTPTGVFKVGSKERWHEFAYPYDGGYAQYATKFHNNLMIHSPIYHSKDINAMTAEFYMDIGGMETAGCLRTVTEAAYWIYTYCEEGTEVEIINGSSGEITVGELPEIDPGFPGMDPTDPFKPDKVTDPVMGISQCPDTGYVNVREGPGTDYPIIARLGDETLVTLLGEAGGWYRVFFLGREAYVIKSAIIPDSEGREPYSERHYAVLPRGSGKEIMKDGSEAYVTDELVDIRAYDDTIAVDLLFAKEDNFTGRKLYHNDICMLQKGTAIKLAKAQELFRKKGFSLIIYDAYRPFSVQKVLFDIIKDPDYVADPSQASHHNRGAAVDIGLLDSEGDPVEFLTPVHTFSEMSSASSQTGDPRTKEAFEYFRSVMESAGFYNYEKEWWHFSDLDFDRYMVTDHDMRQAVIYNSADTGLTGYAGDPEWMLILVNPSCGIPDDFEVDLAQFEGGLVDSRILDECLRMFADARKDGAGPVLVDAYRDQDRQNELFQQKVNSYINTGYSLQDAEAEAAAITARPGTSEHQTGLALDIVDASYRIRDQGFAETGTFAWLEENAHRYGFTLRYKQGREEITGVIYEPWHWRFVGIDAAASMKESGACLEEYLGMAD